MSVFTSRPPETPEDLERFVADLAAALSVPADGKAPNDAYDHLLFHLVEQRPELAWAVIVRAVEVLPKGSVGLLGAGALEDLLSYHPETYLPLAEARALQSENFWHALENVWRFEMPLPYWERLEAFRETHRQRWASTGGGA